MMPLLDEALVRWGLHDGSRSAAALHELARRYGTPLYVYSPRLMESRVAALRAAVPSDLALLYAVKANPHPSVLAHLAPLVDGFDVASAGELERSVGVDAAGGRILSFTGPGKSDADLRAAVSCGAIVVLESLEEARRLAALARDERPRVVLRVNPPFELAAEARMAGGPRKFGVDSEAAGAVLSEIGRLPLAFEGFHVYAGSRCLDALAIAEAQRAILQLVCELAPFAPAPVRLLNLGGGLGIPCFPGESTLDLPTLGDALHALGREARRRLGDLRLMMELGRYLVGEAGLYLARILDRKTSRGRSFLILEGGANHHWHATGALEGRRHLHYPMAVIGGAGRPVERVTVCGPLCAPHDTWAEEVLLPAAAPGDLVAVFQSGAYGASASPRDFLGRPAVHEVLADLH